MTNEKKSRPPLLIVCTGRVAEAAYLPQQIVGYRGNPFIEALPPIMAEDEVMENLARYPPYDDSERLMSPELKLHIIQSALQFFAPLPIHLDLERRFSRMIRAGYQMRNPLRRGFWCDADAKVRSLTPSTSVMPNCARALPLGFTIIGFPGVGKTTSVEAVLSLYPQVILHKEYAGRNFTHTQIVWLKMECPFDGSIKGLCLNFFQTVDAIIGTQYHQNYATGRRTLDELLPYVARVAAAHGIGVLVLDEIQNLSEAKSGGACKMLNFFVQLSNTIGIPVVLVGTYKAKAVLGGEFRQIRRGTGQGDLVWDRMEEGVWIDETDETSGPGVWQLFLESLWTYQYLRTPCPLTAELGHVLYEETQGITDFAVKIYMLAQIRAITVDPGGEERLTANIIRSVARDSLRQAQKVLGALRRGDMRSLSNVEDVHPIKIDSYIKRARIELREAGKYHPGEAKTSGEAVQSPPSAADSGGESVAASRKPSPRRGGRRKKSEAVYPDGDLRAHVAQGAGDGTSAYESLRQAGLIQSPTEFLEEEDAA
jgi:hypothetical protein